MLFAVHTDTEHKHVHFLIGNCNIKTGRAFRKNQKDLYDMCEFFGEQCIKRGLIHSVRENFYNHDASEKEKIGEIRMKSKGNETFKDELREVIQLECADPNNRTLEDVVNALQRHYHVECRVKGNTIWYKHPNFTDKSGNLVSVRGSKLGEKYTVKGIKNELAKARGRERTQDNLSVLTGISSQTGRVDKAEKQERIYITDTRRSDRIGSTADADTGDREHRNMGNVTGAADSRDNRRFQEGRESASHGDSDNKDVPTLEELFASYDRRNGTGKGKRTPKPEPAKSVRKRHQDINR